MIGEVARRSGVSARMLRHYESLGLVRPTGRSGSGYREYSDANIRRVFHIESLRSLGLSLRDVGRALDDPGFAPAELVDDLVRRTRERIAAETELLTRLRRIGAAEPAGWEEVLRITALLQGLGSPSPETRQRAALESAPPGPATPSAEHPSAPPPVPVEALVEAVLGEPDPIVAGALRWALAQTGATAAPLLARGLDSADPEVRVRAVRSLAELPDAGATALLREAHAHPDPAVRGYAALALGVRGVAEAVPTLVGMVVEERNDADAADALGALAADPARAEAITTALVDRLTRTTTTPPTRRRLTQALADIPGPAATRALAELSRDPDRAVALTATYVLGLRAGR
ncbi:MerR family transcriptional regulator [Streptomyces showdoensis]|uniref:MerR family transcriptional regulator n=1 Tax=Streptomyces showdoensis TaxID=68268 RepID=A0A2P2GTD4_STREW|nr:MerR family transcriptional regulator [Streptomyces showdoensis]